MDVKAASLKEPETTGEEGTGGPGRKVSSSQCGIIKKVKGRTKMAA